MKLTSVLSDVVGVSSRRILEALIGGECDPQVLAELTTGAARRKIAALVAALDGDVSEHHAWMCRHYLDEIDHLAQLVAVLDARVASIVTALAREQHLDNLDTIPGVRRSAFVRAKLAHSTQSHPALEPPGHRHPAGLCGWLVRGG